MTPAQTRAHLRREVARWTRRAATGSSDRTYALQRVLAAKLLLAHWRNA